MVLNNVLFRFVFIYIGYKSNVYKTETANTFAGSFDILNLFQVKARLGVEMAGVFGFGLFHGLGFASAMTTQLNGARFPVSTVLGFNLGVEIGQVAIAFVFGFVFWLLKSLPSIPMNIAFKAAKFKPFGSFICVNE